MLRGKLLGWRNSDYRLSKCVLEQSGFVEQHPGGAKFPHILGIYHRFYHNIHTGPASIF